MERERGRRDNRPDELSSFKEISRRNHLKLAAQNIIKALRPNEVELLDKTPDRFASAFEREPFSLSLIESASTGVVLIKDLPFWSMCEHHLLPFIGKAAISYLPNGKLLGLSKFARLLEREAWGLNIQETLTDKIADCLMEILEPKGLGVILEATHLCMAVRGIKALGATTVTSVVRGSYRTSGSELRAEFLQLWRG